MPIGSTGSLDPNEGQTTVELTHIPHIETKTWIQRIKGLFSSSSDNYQKLDEERQSDKDNDISKRGVELDFINSKEDDLIEDLQSNEKILEKLHGINLEPTEENSVEDATDKNTLLSIDIAAEKKAAKIRTLKAIGCMTISSLCFSLMSLFVKLGSSQVGGLQIQFTRSFIGGVLGILFSWKKGISPWGPPEYRKLMIIRGCIVVISGASFFFAVTKLPLGTATVLNFFGPIFTAILAWIFLKERWEALDAIGSGLCIVGAVLVSRPSFIFGGAENMSMLNELFYMGISLLGAFTGGSSNVIVRKVGSNIDPIVYVHYFSVLSVIFLPFAILLMEGFVWPNWISWLYLFGTGTIAFIGQYFSSWGIQIEKAAKATAISYAQIPFTFIWELVILKSDPNLMGVIGVLIICAWIIVAVIVRSRFS